jgi:hypothetical protein
LSLPAWLFERDWFGFVLRRLPVALRHCRAKKIQPWMGLPICLMLLALA